MFHPPQVPYGYTVVGSTPPNRASNGPGLAALILGIVSVILAFIPFANFFAFLTGPAGVIVGIVGLVLADRPRRQAAWGTALSAASMVLAFIMIFVYTFGFIFAIGGFFEEAQRNLPTATATPLEVPTPRSTLQVLSLGTVVELYDDNDQPAYDATVSASVLDATDQVGAVDGNPDAPAGYQWALVTIDVTSLTLKGNAPAEHVVVEFVDEDGDVLSQDTVATAPEPQLASFTSLAVGESVTGNIVIAIPTDAVDTGFWLLSHRDAVDHEDPAYYETE